jgi:poly(3-hydroxyalkanoate) synthetase
VLDLWDPALQGREGSAALQLRAGDAAPSDAGSTSEAAALLARFRHWYDTTVDLPGAYYHQIVSWLFKENRLAEGRFTALGRRIDLRDVRHPLFLLAARDDELVAPEQLMAAARLVGTLPADIATAVEPCGHLALFMGATTLRGTWADIARWLAQPSST